MLTYRDMAGPAGRGVVPHVAARRGRRAVWADGGLPEGRWRPGHADDAHTIGRSAVPGCSLILPNQKHILEIYLSL